MKGENGKEDFKIRDWVEKKMKEKGNKANQHSLYKQTRENSDMEGAYFEL